MGFIKLRRYDSRSPLRKKRTTRKASSLDRLLKDPQLFYYVIVAALVTSVLFLAAAFFIAFLPYSLFLAKSLEVEAYSVSASVQTVQEYKLNPGRKLCTEKKRKLLLMIIAVSSPRHISRRAAIRESWGSLVGNDNARLAFLLGITRKKSLQKRIHQEAEKFLDIIQVGFPDYSRTQKSQVCVNWVTFYCPNVQYLLKVADDTFIDVGNMVNFLESWQGKHGILFSTKPEGAESRLTSNCTKFYDSSIATIYTQSNEPSYASGSAFIMLQDIAQSLHFVAQEMPHFVLDDIAPRIRIACRDNKGFVYGKVPSKKPLENLNSQENLIAVYNVTSAEQWKIWLQIHRMNDVARPLKEPGIFKQPIAYIMPNSLLDSILSAVNQMFSGWALTDDKHGKHE